MCDVHPPPLRAFCAARLQRPRRPYASSSRLRLQGGMSISRRSRSAVWASGLHAALLLYEEKRLIASIGRSGLRRVFDPGVLERLALIALGRNAGFSLDEIAACSGSMGGRGSIATPRGQGRRVGHHDPRLRRCGRGCGTPPPARRAPTWPVPLPPHRAGCGRRRESRQSLTHQTFARSPSPSRHRFEPLTPLEGRRRRPFSVPSLRREGRARGSCD